jgi:hypothetical protein
MTANRSKSTSEKTNAEREPERVPFQVTGGITAWEKDELPSLGLE